ncbi:unnamed protein product, partial [Porites evermanni]
MASCGYSTFVGGPCGASPSNPADATCVAIDKCTKDVKSHLNQHDCFDSSSKTEADLLLARAGIFKVDDNHIKMSICPRHRDAFGIRWRSGKRTCLAPKDWAAHKSKQVKGDQGIT